VFVDKSFVGLPNLKPVFNSPGFPMCPKDHSKQHLAQGALMGVTTSKNTEEEKGHMIQDASGGGGSVYLGYRQPGKAKEIIVTSC